MKKNDKVLITKIIPGHDETPDDIREMQEYIGKIGRISHIEPDGAPMKQYPIAVDFKNENESKYFNEKELVSYNKTTKILFGNKVRRSSS